MRRHLRPLSLSALLVAALGACGQPDLTDDALARVCALRDQTCACKTAACLTEAATAEQALDAWFSENRRALDAQRTPAFDREWQATRREVAACKAAIGEQVGR